LVGRVPGCAAAYLLASGPEVWLVKHGFLSLRASLYIDYPINVYCEHFGFGWEYIRDYQRRFYR
jgi:hypothetical protein